MSDSPNKNAVSTAFAIGGGLMLGLGVGFFLLTINPLFFVGSLIAGIGLGLLLGAYLARK